MSGNNESIKMAIDFTKVDTSISPQIINGMFYAFSNVSEDEKNRLVDTFKIYGMDSCDQNKKKSN